MPYQATTYNVMIASPGDVGAERLSIRQTLADWNAIHSEARRIVLLPLGWETHSVPEMGQHPQKALNKQIGQRSDMLVGLFWTRIGTPTDTHASGSVEEVEEHIAAGKPVMLYFSNQPVKLDSVDSERYAKLLAFKASCKDRGLFQEYSDAADFREKFFRQLQMKLNEDSYFATATPPNQIVELVPASPSLSAEAQQLLAAAAQGDGVIMRLHHLGGLGVQAGGRSLVESADRRVQAKWEAAVDELEIEGLIEDKKGLGEVYFMTNNGYQAADALPKPK